MNKSECRKYIRRAYKMLMIKKEDITPESIEHEIKNIIDKDIEQYIAYTKIAVYNMNNCANKQITLKDLYDEINILPKIYSKSIAIIIAIDL